MDQIDKDISMLAKDSRIESIERLDEDRVKIDTNDLICESSSRKTKVYVGKVSFTIDFSQSPTPASQVKIENKTFDMESSHKFKIIAPMVASYYGKAWACWLGYNKVFHDTLRNKDLLVFTEAFLKFICSDTAGYYTSMFPEV